ncbi:hypothetical protein [Aeromicrobium sp. A1-2]|uniref:hypothetical protein n=1 Tax=Aeromicrobium sp. A1-2 TaxID=2107713 RepID=UPI0013C33A7A|nr:hypothetical protein [Aeromicrobium sp. A1-2]
MSDLRSIVTKVVIVSFSIAALMGIIALVGGGSFGGTEERVLLTTVIVGVESIAVLCYLAVSGRPLVYIGMVGGVASVVPFGIALVLAWGGYDGGDWLWRTFGIGLTVAASIAQVCLLLALAGHQRIGPGLLATLATITIIAAMIVLPIASDADRGDTYWRIFGVVAILDVLGTVILAAVRAFGPGRRNDGSTVLLTPATQARIIDAARLRGTSPEQVLSDALDVLLD